MDLEQIWERESEILLNSSETVCVASRPIRTITLKTDKKWKKLKNEIGNRMKVRTKQISFCTLVQFLKYTQKYKNLSSCLELRTVNSLYSNLFAVAAAAA